MARRIRITGPLTDEQIKMIYAAAAKFGVHIRLWNEGFGPNREYFKWAVEGSILKIGKMLSLLKTLG